MSIANKISVNTHYTRSINITRDADSASIVKSYIPTSRALKTLEQVSESLLKKECPRSWSLVGPYGSGKSSFGIFLAHLLDTAAAGHKEALTVLQNNSKEISSSFKDFTNNNEGYATILITGAPESLIKSIANEVHRKATNIWETRKGKKPKFIELLRSLIDTNEIKVSELISIIRDFQIALKNIGYSGLLIVIDELGKFLEYEARHFENNDIFVLQSLAEEAYSDNDVKLGLVVMLHQSIEQYAKGLGESMRSEWAKIQGRFENIPFIDNSEQTLRVVSSAIEKDFTQNEKTTVEKKITSDIDTLLDCGALPKTLKKDAANDLFYKCYPLHPVSALILPLLCQKVAQNERTLFSYLGSQETHGFVDSLKSIESFPEQITPNEIFDYFIRNQSISTSDHYTYRRWAEVMTAIERLGDDDIDSLFLLKIIGLLNIIGSKGGLKASKEVLLTCVDPKTFDQSIKTLQDKSLINFRSFNSEYRVWQGSDFDIETEVEKQINQLGQFSIADKLNNRHELLPVVARKYSIENGALRYFEPVFISASDYENLDKSERNPRIIFFLSESTFDDTIFLKDILNYFNSDDIFVLCSNGSQIRESLTEVLALEQVSNKSQQLKTDPVAQKEFKDKYNAAVEKESFLLNNIISTPHANRWFRRGKEELVASRRYLQTFLSESLEQIYSKSPIIKNELINRNKPSSQANTARNKLISMMLDYADQEDLNIDKFPPEKAIYRSVFKSSGLHYKDASGNWKFANYDYLKTHNPSNNFMPLLEEIHSFLKETHGKPKSFIELNEKLLSAPFGIKVGLLSLLYVFAIISYQDNLAVTEEDVFVPYLTEDHLQRFLKRPDTFKFELIDFNVKLLNEYSEVWTKGDKPDTILKIVKEIARIISPLPEYTHQTKIGVEDESRALLNAFKFSKSPVKLLREDIPQALGLNIDNKEDVLLFKDKLRSALLDLQGAYERLRSDFARIFAQGFNMSDDLKIKDIRSAISPRLRGLEDFTIDEKGQRGFIVRATKSDEQIADDEWFDNLLMFLVSKPPKSWRDIDKSAAEYQLKILIKQVKELEKLRAAYVGLDGTESADVDVYVLNSIKAKGSAFNEIVKVDKDLKEASESTKKEILDLLESINNKDIGKAVLAQVLDNYLIEKTKSSNKAEEEKDDTSGVA